MPMMASAVITSTMVNPRDRTLAFSRGRGPVTKFLPPAICAPVRIRSLLIAGVLAAQLAAGRQVLACSVCGCDPAALTLGLDRPSWNSLRVGVEDRYLTKESGLAQDYEGERENRMLVRAQFAPLRNFVAAVDVPVFLWREHIGAEGSVDDTGRGLG